jgi:hypothetical protein
VLFVPQSGLSGWLNKNAYSTIDLSARRSAQMGRSMKKLWGEMNYFLRHKLFVIVTAIASVFSYGFAITHESIGVDDTIVGLYLEDGLEVVMGRWTVFLINKVFHVSDFTPFITELAGLLLLLTASVLFCVLLRRIFGDRIGILGYTAFAGAFVTFPFISEVWVYYYHDGVDIGYVLTAFSLLFFMDSMEKSKRVRLKYVLISMLFLWGAVGCYESFIIFYLLGVVMLLFFRGMADKEKLTFRWLFENLFLCFCAAVGCMILRSAVQRVIIAVFSLPEANSRDLTYGLQLFENGEWLQNIFMLLKKYWLVYCVNGAVYFPITVYVLSLAVFGAASVVYTIKKKNGWYLLLFLAMIIIPAILTFVELKPPLYRACQYMPFFVASAVLLVYILMVRKMTKRENLVFAALASCLIWNQAYESNFNFYTDYRKYEYDKTVLEGIAGTVAGEYGENAEVIFTGSYMPPYELVERYYADYSSEEFARISFLTDWLDPCLKEKYYSPYGYSFAGEAQYSIIDWGLYAFDKPGLELARFLQMHGYDLKTVTDPELVEKAEAFAEEMPRWPGEGSVTEWNGYIVVHF